MDNEGNRIEKIKIIIRRFEALGIPDITIKELKDWLEEEIAKDGCITE